METRKKIIQICCPGRSGSTLLDMILGNNSYSMSVGEVHALYRPWKKEHCDPKCSCGDTNCSYWKDINRFNERAFHDHFFGKKGLTVIVDSSKSPEWIYDMNKLSSSKYDIYNVLLYKSPKNLVYSYYKRGKWELGVEKYKTYYKMFEEIGVDHYTVSYKDLVEDKTSTLIKLCEYLDIDYDPSMVNFVESKYEKHHLFGSFGIKKQLKGKTFSLNNTDYPDEFNNWWEKSNSFDKDQVDMVFSKLESKKNREVKGISKILPYWLLKLKLKRFVKYSLSFGDRCIFVRDK